MLSDDQTRLAFEAHVGAWVEYHESLGGRLRHAVILHHVRDHLSQRARLLDVGSSTGELAADLARDGHPVTLLDFSRAMLNKAAQRCAGLDVQQVFADAAATGELFEPESFDAVICHSMIDFVDQPGKLFKPLAQVLRKGGMLSLVFSNRYHAPLRLAIIEKNLRGAREGLESEMPTVDLFGVPWRAFYPETIRQMIESSGLQVVGEYGVRIFVDLIADGCEAWDELLDLELSASARMPYCQMGRFVQLIAVKP